MSRPPVTRAGVARVLRALRETSGISQEGLAASAGVDRSYVGSVERGRRNPTILLVDRLLAIIGVSWVEFGAALDRDARGAANESRGAGRARRPPVRKAP